MPTAGVYRFRMHEHTRITYDNGKPGTYYLFVLIPLVGSIILLVWFCQDSTGDNQWGPNPKC